MDIWGIQIELRDEFTKCALITRMKQVFLDLISEATILREDFTKDKG